MTFNDTNRHYTHPHVRWTKSKSRSLYEDVIDVYVEVTIQTNVYTGGGKYKYYSLILLMPTTEFE